MAWFSDRYVSDAGEISPGEWTRMVSERMLFGS